MKIRDRIYHLEAEIAELKCLAKYPGISLDTEILLKIDDDLVKLREKSVIYTIDKRRVTMQKD
jgi:hypothetical protein